MNYNTELSQNWCAIHLIDNPLDELKPCSVVVAIAKAKKGEREYVRAN